VALESLRREGKLKQEWWNELEAQRNNASLLSQ